MQLTSVLLSWQTLILSEIIAYRLLRGVTVLYSKARQIIFSSLLLFIVSCNSNTTYDKKVLNDLNKYELSAKELVEHFDSLAPINNSRDTNFHSFILYSNQIIEGENEIYKKHFPLPQTRKLCLDNPPAFI